MASISSPGIGSGIDVGGLIDQLVAAERQPTAQRLDAREADIQAEISGLGTLKSAISDFTSALASLKDGTTFSTRTATSGDASVFTATADDTAVAGSFGVKVVTLAQAHKLTSAGFSGPSSAVGGGSLTISVGTASFTVDITAGSDSLAEVRDAINGASANTGVSATLVTVDAAGGGSETRLVLSADASGTSNTLTVTASDADGNDTDNAGLSRLVYDPAGSGATNLSELQGAVDAEIEIDGMAVTRSGNTISDAIDGVTLELLATSTGKVSLDVSTDQGAVRNAIDAFVTAYNDLSQSISTLSSYDATTGSHGVLLGDATLRGVEETLFGALSASVSGGGSIRHLTELGITTQADGSLAVDDAKLSAALASGLDDVGQFFSASDGLAVRLDGLLQPYVESSGVIDERNTSLDQRVEDLNEQRDSLDRRMASLQDRLLAQFTAMDKLVSELQSTSSFLTTQLANFTTSRATNR